MFTYVHGHPITKSQFPSPTLNHHIVLNVGIEKIYFNQSIEVLKYIIMSSKHIYSYDQQEQNYVKELLKGSSI